MTFQITVGQRAHQPSEIVQVHIVYTVPTAGAKMRYCAASYFENRQDHFSYVTRYEKHFRAAMKHRLRLSSKEKICASIKRPEHPQQRISELDQLFLRVYADNVAGEITDERFFMMSRSYEDEQTQLQAEIQTLQQDMEAQERQIEHLEHFIQRGRKYEDLQEPPPLLCVTGACEGNLHRSAGKEQQQTAAGDPHLL